MEICNRRARPRASDQWAVKTQAPEPFWLKENIEALKGTSRTSAVLKKAHAYLIPGFGMRRESLVRVNNHRPQSGLAGQ